MPENEALMEVLRLSPEEWAALRLSLQVAVVATLVVLPLAIAIGYLLARCDFIGKSAIETLVYLPLVMPPVVTGYLLLIAFGRQGIIGRWLTEWLGIQLVFDWKGAALASAVMALPLMVRTIRLAIADVDVRFEQAARTLGLGPLETVLRVTLPLARRGLSAGAVLGFARSMGEFGATIMIAGNIPGQTQTAPLYIYSELNAPGGFEQGLRLVVVSVLVSAAALALSERLERGSRPRNNLARGA
jgi:molybdate transport system permease protein